MPKTSAVILMACVLLGCAPGAPPKSEIHADTQGDMRCVIKQLGDEKHYHEIEDACMPGQWKHLAVILALLETSDDLLKERAWVSAQSSIVLHEEERQQGLRPPRLEKK